MKTKREKRFLVLGVGNILLKDEGLGVRTVEYINGRYILPSGVSVVDGGTGGLSLLSLVRDFDHIIIIDAVASNSSPGAVYRIPGSELPKSPPLMTTAHEIGVKEMLAMAALEGLHPEVVVIGMEPHEISPGLELSKVVRDKIPLLAGLVVDELKGLGVEVRDSERGEMTRA